MPCGMLSRFQMDCRFAAMRMQRSAGDLDRTDQI